MEERLSKSEGRKLLKLARTVIGKKLGLVEKIYTEGLKERAFGQKLGTFVTIKIDNTLRGCIGNIEPAGTVVESVRSNAMSSAFSDYRFPPLTVEEFSRITIDISILSDPRKLEYLDGDDLVRQLMPVHGVILGRGNARATFLPQVWEQLPEPEQFLGHLCLKAGLSQSAWRELHPDIFVYEVLHFEEDGLEAGTE